MIIPITTPPESESGTPQHPRLARLGNELFLLEMQGKLEVEGSKEGGFVGVLGLDDSDKPLGILTKHKSGAGTTYEITEIVTKKVIFTKRPTPMVGHAGGCTRDGELKAGGDDQLCHLFKLRQRRHSTPENHAYTRKKIQPLRCYYKPKDEFQAHAILDRSWEGK
ncbi:hypothetical protein OPQ81_001867 [Rhizoctonia solani]|nr:hypothetical protein OPQ81_001867 [Rhizoctonia solani]